VGIKVIVALSNLIFSEGVCKLLEGRKDIVISEVLKPDASYSAEKLGAMGPDVVVTDLASLYNNFPGLGDAKTKYRFILLDTNCGRENIITAFLNKKICGVVMSNSNTDHLVKAICGVVKGEIWIDKHTVKDLLHGVNALNSGGTSVLSDREKDVVALIGQGFRNKEVAQRLKISEPTVKSHLSRIFRKLNVRSRSELVAYSIKNKDMDKNFFGNVSP